MISRNRFTRPARSISVQGSSRAGKNFLSEYHIYFHEAALAGTKFPCTSRKSAAMWIFCRINPGSFMTSRITQRRARNTQWQIAAAPGPERGQDARHFAGNNGTATCRSMRNFTRRSPRWMVFTKPGIVSAQGKSVFQPHRCFAPARISRIST